MWLLNWWMDEPTPVSYMRQNNLVSGVNIGEFVNAETLSDLLANLGSVRKLFEKCSPSQFGNYSLVRVEHPLVYSIDGTLDILAEGFHDEIVVKLEKIQIPSRRQLINYGLQEEKIVVLKSKQRMRLHEPWLAYNHNDIVALNAGQKVAEEIIPTLIDYSTEPVQRDSFLDTFK